MSNALANFIRVGFLDKMSAGGHVAVLSVIGVEIRVEELRRQIQSSGFGKTGSPTH